MRQGTSSEVSECFVTVSDAHLTFDFVVINSIEWPFFCPPMW